MKVQLKNIKSWNTHDGGGVQFNVYVDGKRSFEFTDKGNGGDYNIDLLDTKEGPLSGRADVFKSETGGVSIGEHQSKGLKSIIDHVMTLPSEKSDLYPDGHAPTVVGYLFRLLDKAEEEKSLKRWCRTKTVISTPDSKDGEYITFKCKFDEKVRAFIQKKYGPEAVIHNERFSYGN
jgi:hypothetical protein